MIWKCVIHWCLFYILFITFEKFRRVCQFLINYWIYQFIVRHFFWKLVYILIKLFSNLTSIFRLPKSATKTKFLKLFISNSKFIWNPNFKFFQLWINSFALFIGVGWKINFGKRDSSCYLNQSLLLNFYYEQFCNCVSFRV